MCKIYTISQVIDFFIKENPYQTPPSYEKLIGNLKGFYSRRINIQHRIAYAVYEKENTVKILRMPLMDKALKTLIIVRIYLWARTRHRVHTRNRLR
ncbi:MULTISPECIES: Txe/YoeB family addiction module toxin [unclassified Clostridium]|uniref:Txe/YoeB family addiction module toxin n=1 Tax=unclassified Clostridium TaxID=2614128 RepID=UPI0013E917A1|nr:MULTISPECIES: Txe/YoeB family addiction module toxin [unclassified Clostridium]MBZ9626153.1 Txe/YoeB family addiction module toxin [Clostridium sp. FP2]MBZ9637752.1 Txe/YoeB family addiction module toxin [Clostridium sp. FP1]